MQAKKKERFEEESSEERSAGRRSLLEREAVGGAKSP